MASSCHAFRTFARWQPVRRGQDDDHGGSHACGPGSCQAPEARARRSSYEHVSSVVRDLDGTVRHRSRGVRERRQGTSAAGRRSGPADRCRLRPRARDQRSAGRTAARLPTRAPGTLGGSARGLKARRAALASCRGRQGDGRPAQALAGVHPLSRGWPDRPQQQGRQARPAWCGPWAPRLAVPWLGSWRAAAAMCTLIGKAKRNDIDPQAWLVDILERMAGHPVRHLQELLPWHWQPSATTTASCSPGPADHAHACGVAPAALGEWIRPRPIPTPC
jgi:hypothetical protein